MIGRVVSTKMQKTAVVVVERQKKHPLYKKTFMRSKKFLVDDLLGVKEGDVVEFVRVRPISKNKHAQIVKVIGKNLQEIMEEKLKMAAKEVIDEVMPEEKTKESSAVSLQTEETDEKQKKPRKKKGQSES